MTDVPVYYFIRRGTDGEESLSKRRATLEAIQGQGQAVMQSRRVDRKSVLLLESRELRNEAQALRHRVDRLSAPPEPYSRPRFSART